MGPALGGAQWRLMRLVAAAARILGPAGWRVQCAAGAAARKTMPTES